MGNADRTKGREYPFVIAYVKGDRSLADCAATLEGAKTRVTRRLSKPHNRAEVCEVFLNGQIIFCAARDGVIFEEARANG